jgi:hypothetical protein
VRTIAQNGLAVENRYQSEGDVLQAWKVRSDCRVGQTRTFFPKKIGAGPASAKAPNSFPRSPIFLGGAPTSAPTP